ncbi:hypothetical protein BBJ28_00027144 [Nothophytophthora sp. Chile5]|nr:hypothetical protein BBJ28_00027144 [Nothophytophthora sp. Chile5]
MSLSTAPSSASAIDAALLEVAHSRRTIYENTRMSGENRHRHHVLPVDCVAERTDCCSDATEAAYARNLARHFGEPVKMPTPPLRRRYVSSRSRPHEAALDAALLALAHSQLTIYEKARLSGENRHTHHVLPTDHQAERTDRCSDATDNSYANAMANFFVTSSASRL